MKKCLILLILIVSYIAFSEGWSQQYIIPTTGRLWDCDFSDIENGWVVGLIGSEGVILSTSNGGIDWDVQFTYGSELRAVEFLNDNVGWAVGRNGTILHTSNGGVNWFEQESNTVQDLFDTSFIDETEGWVVGYDGVTLHTTNGGIIWENLGNASISYLLSVSFIDSEIGWSCGLYGMVYKTIDGGETWNAINIYQFGNPTDANDVFFLDNDNGWVVGSRYPAKFPGYVPSLHYTGDGGETWSYASFYKTLNSIYFVDNSTGWSVGEEGYIIHTSDGGENWFAQESCTEERLLDVYFIDINNGWIVGDSSILHTTNGGVVGINNSENLVSYELCKNYPNPFNPATTISFSLKRDQAVQVNIFDIYGKKIAELVNGYKNAGSHQVEFNGSDLTSGEYFYKIETEDFSEVQKMLLLK